MTEERPEGGYSDGAVRGRTLTGFFDWGFAGPASPERDLALAAFAWVPLHARPAGRPQYAAG
jgi:aminoglycoside phosphotransferase (APT) family kinase protein